MDYQSMKRRTRTSNETSPTIGSQIQLQSKGMLVRSKTILPNAKPKKKKSREASHLHGYMCLSARTLPSFLSLPFQTNPTKQLNYILRSRCCTLARNPFTISPMRRTLSNSTCNSSISLSIARNLAISASALCIAVAAREDCIVVAVWVCWLSYNTTTISTTHIHTHTLRILCAYSAQLPQATPKKGSMGGKGRKGRTYIVPPCLNTPHQPLEMRTQRLQTARIQEQPPLRTRAAGSARARRPRLAERYLLVLPEQLDFAVGEAERGVRDRGCGVRGHGTRCGRGLLLCCDHGWPAGCSARRATMRGNGWGRATCYAGGRGEAD